MSSKKIVTPEFRVSFPHVFKPAENNFGGEPKYTVTMLYSKKQDLSVLKGIVDEAIREKWADKPPKGLRSPFRDGDEKDYDGYENVIFCSATSRDKPGVVDDQTQPIIEQGDFYAGCYARATIVAYAYDRAGNRGVAFGLHNLQKLREGETFTGRSKAEDDFTPIEKPVSSGNADLLNLGGSKQDLG